MVASVVGTEASKLKQEKRWTMVSDSGRGYRRVVPSPRPLSIVEARVIRGLQRRGHRHSGWWGRHTCCVPSGRLNEWCEAVIDKDLSAALLASDVGADMLLILTDVENVMLDYGKPTARALSRLTRDECERYLNESQFGAGSMKPKIEAAVAFLDSGGKAAVVTSLERAREAVTLRAGTVIVPHDFSNRVMSMS